MGISKSNAPQSRHEIELAGFQSIIEIKRAGECTREPKKKKGVSCADHPKITIPGFYCILWRWNLRRRELA
jgi:hypothetical protein